MNPNDQDIERALKSLKKDTSPEWESSTLGYLQEISQENVTDQSNLRISLRDQHDPPIFYSFFNTPMKRLFTTFGTIAAVFVLAFALQSGFNSANPNNTLAYRVDLGFERVELFIANLRGKDSLARKHVDHANERIEEIDALLENSGVDLASLGSLFIQTAYASELDSFFDVDFSIKIELLLGAYEESLAKAADQIPKLEPKKAAKIIDELADTVKGITRVVGKHSIKGSKFDLQPINQQVQQVIIRVTKKTKNAGMGMLPESDDQANEDSAAPNLALSEALNALDKGTETNQEILKKFAKGQFMVDQGEDDEEGALSIDPFILEYLFTDSPPLVRGGAPTESVVLCNDTDNGQDKFVRGTVQRGDVISEDVCFNAGSDQKFETEIVSMNLNSDSNVSNGIVQEYYCAKDNSIKTALYNCSGSCSEGACKKPPVFDLSKAPASGIVEICVDTDGGVIGQEYIKGQATKGSKGAGDTCSKPNLLAEFACVGGEVKEIEFNCDCEDGACKKIAAVPASESLKVTLCKDTDGGGAGQEFIKGQATKGTKGAGDYCNPNGLVLVEGICLNGEPTTKDFTCLYGCSADTGACRKEAVTVEAVKESNAPIIQDASKIPAIVTPEDEESVIILPGTLEGFNPQPEPPGDEIIPEDEESVIILPGTLEGFNPQPEPPGDEIMPEDEALPAVLPAILPQLNLNR